ncbi:hypothetical protein SPRG_05593 [Saprolegnia parasitica CBS 223.65]|uniref:Restriction endonuclease domain-containing protein n=1 Tax=Saprolegnia parasitica (strain CBS 223.65) TaxID=695850 RepID=A0A067CSZ8_SAPPC|nr:hypothetical protein SPRG_05593 [Saprolegnia parasitica CBS 223.65]KDO29641.1 hypothetical protein SPRG_05593 [Saprolegnia parasitica CBS 223.65]|eukprot:XP_012199700.1 hypothetical protein SPRG_05593 [Saprolegnia parasitica CBS 223.65]
MRSRVTEAGLMAAIHEFKRREANGDGDDLLIAQNVLLRRWLDGPYSSGAVFRATYDGDVITKTTRGDIYMTEVPGEVHQESIARIYIALDTALAGTPLKCVKGVDYNHAGYVRRPDLAIRPTHAVLGDAISTLPRCMIEVTVTHRTSFHRHDRDTRALFREFPPLQTVLVLVLYPLRDAATLDPNMNPILAQMPALAVLYRRLGNDIAITDAMSCGNVALDDGVHLPGHVDVRNEVDAMAAELPQVVERQPHDHGPSITLLGDDLYRAADGHGHIIQGLLPDYPVYLATTIAAAIRTGYEEAAQANGLAAYAAAQAAAQAAAEQAAAAAPNVGRHNQRYNLRP